MHGLGFRVSFEEKNKRNMHLCVGGLSSKTIPQFLFHFQITVERSFCEDLREDLGFWAHVDLTNMAHANFPPTLIELFRVLSIYLSIYLDDCKFHPMVLSATGVEPYVSTFMIRGKNEYASRCD